MRPASEVAREWCSHLCGICRSAMAMTNPSALTAMLEARDAEVRADERSASAVARPVLNDGRSGPQNPEQPGTRSASEVADTERAQRFIRDHKIEAPNKLTDEWLTSRLAAVFAEVRAAALEEAAREVVVDMCDGDFTCSHALCNSARQAAGRIRAMARASS